MATSHECPFYLGQSSKEHHAELYAEIEARFPRKNEGKNKSTGKKKVLFSKPDEAGFIHVGAAKGIACIDAIPPSPSPPPASVKPAGGSIVPIPPTDSVEAILRPDLRGNEEATQLMRETLRDEADFAAADAATKNPSGSPPLSIAYC